MTAALPERDADWVAGILALKGPQCGGVVLGEDVGERFLAALGGATGSKRPMRQLPSNVGIDVFSGALDFAATLALGQPVRLQGLLQGEDVTNLMIRRAEALEVAIVSCLAQMLDDQRLLLAAVTDLSDQDAALSSRLADRLAFCVETEVTSCWSQQQIEAARTAAISLPLAPSLLNDLCTTACALGISSPRTVLHACHAAQAIAALQGVDNVTEAAVSRAARLVFAHRATRLPVDDDVEQPQDTQTPSPDKDASGEVQASEPSHAEVVLDSVRAAIPLDLLQALASGAGKRGSGRNVKSASKAKTKSTRGRRVGSRRALSLSGQRLDLITTLRNAAPWQTLRRRAAAVDRMIVTRDDFQIHRIKQRNEATAIFVVDASGSTAFQRLAEAKGAVEAILAECYIRRDKVALVSFRSKTAEELLPPTRSLERARRALTALPGGGGTPLAAGLDKAFQLADQVRRAGATPIVIILTDGRANVTRDGEGNKLKALAEAETAARLFAVEGVESMVIDVSPEPQRHARVLADNMAATYLAMPRAQAADIARPVTTALRQRT